MFGQNGLVAGPVVMFGGQFLPDRAVEIFKVGIGDRLRSMSCRHGVDNRDGWLRQNAGGRGDDFKVIGRKCSMG